MPAVFRIKNFITRCEKVTSAMYEHAADQILGIKRNFHIALTNEGRNLMEFNNS